MNSQQLTYAKKIHEILSSTENGLLNKMNNNVPELDLISLTRSLIKISELNKKYSTVHYDEDFMLALTEHEEESFLEQLTLINKMLMCHISKYYEEKTS
jgi:hypothetical protein